MNSNNFDTTFFSGYFKIILISYNHKETKERCQERFKMQI